MVSPWRLGSKERHAGPPGGAAAAPGGDDILTGGAVAFLADLHREFEPRRRELLRMRELRTAAFRKGVLPRFAPATARIREADWQVAPAPAELADRRVEITGPVDRKMVINALNSGAKVFMADFEDANSPTWENLLEGQRNLSDALDRTLALDTPQRATASATTSATLFVRPRGWHLVERHVTVDGEPMSGSLFDFGLYFFRNQSAGAERPLLLPAEDRVAPRGAALERRLRLGRRTRLGVPRGRSGRPC